MDPAPDPNGGGGGGGGNPDPNPPPDPAEPTLASLKISDLSKMISDALTPALNGLDAKFESRLKKFGAPPAAPPTSNPNPPNPNPNPPSDPFASAREKELTTRLEAIEEERKTEKQQAQQMQLDAEVSSALADFTWAEGDGKQIAREFYKAKAARDQSGNLVIGDMPLSRYIKEHVPRGFKGMLQARPVGGSGAQPNNPGSTGPKGSVDLNDIRPGMSKETEDAAMSQIAGLYQQLQQNR